MSKKIEDIKVVKLTKFEKTRLLSARALEIANGSAPKVDVSKLGGSISLTRDYVKIAQREYDEGLIELEVYRKLI